jgi:hypothetical protein
MVLLQRSAWNTMMLIVKVTSLENAASDQWLLEAMLFSMTLPLDPKEAVVLLIWPHPASHELQDRGLQKPELQMDNHLTWAVGRQHRWDQCHQRYLAGHVVNLDHGLVDLLWPSFLVLLAWLLFSNPPFSHGQQPLVRLDPEHFGSEVTGKELAVRTGVFASALHTPKQWWNRR